MIDEIKKELELLNEHDDTEYENFVRKCGYLLALRNHEIISFNDFIKILREL